MVYQVNRVQLSGSTRGHQIQDENGVKVVGTQSYGDSKRAEAQALCDMLNAAFNRGVEVGADNSTRWGISVA